MRIVVAVKQVPARDSQFRINPSGDWIDESSLSYEMNEPDAYALEEALQLKEKHGGEVIAISAGPVRVAQTIREALAKGADRGIHVEHDYSGVLDSFSATRMLAAAVRPEAPDLLLTGLQSDDLGYGQTGVILAELLGLPHAPIVMDVQVADGGVTVKRELENGWFQKVSLPLPCVLTVQSGIRKLRYATLMGIKKAKSKQVATVPAPSFSAESAGVSLDRVYAPDRTKKTEILDGNAAEAAAKLIEKLRFEARVL